ncbi:MAG TPA: N-acyl homoserine lactonase family protein [Solirubrobacteraceae bacterium]|jgi:N-acyl homoserine lactone hydrolase|nr:N-acyl homoserine lactonase family protein [Solirubrobacteraceae bacterium]
MSSNVPPEPGVPAPSGETAASHRASGGGVGVELEVMLTGEVSIPYGYVYRAAGNRVSRLLAALRPGGEMLRSPCLAYAVRHPAAGTILIDTGMHPDAGRSLRRDFGAPMGVLFRGLRPARMPFDEQLRALGIEPDGVERVIMTHLHVDHTSGMRLLPNARFACAREEWTATGKRFAVGNGYVSHHLPPSSAMELLDFDRDGEAYATFTKTIDLLGDGSIRLIFTPGHTVGHLSVLLRLAGARPVLVIGDAAYTLRNVREGILPLLTANDGAAMRSLREIEAFAEREPDAILVPSHDPTAWHELRHVSASAKRAASSS